MRKLGILVFTVFVTALLLLGLSSCGEEPHTHSFAEEWSKDAAMHWKAATCGHDDRQSIAPHAFNQEHICMECGYAGEHSYSSPVKNDQLTHTKTCECGSSITERCSGGSAACGETPLCTVCGTYYGEPLSHIFDEENTDGRYLFSAAGCHAKAQYYHSCSRRGCNEQGDTLFEVGEIDLTKHDYSQYTEAVPADCQNAGSLGYYYCWYCRKNVDVNGREITELSTPIDPTVHDFGEWNDEVPATCLQTGTKGHKSCGRCSKNFDADGVEISDLVIPVNQTAHTFNRQNTDDAYLAGGATCTTGATFYYSCECGEAGSDSFVGGTVDPAAHAFGVWVEEVPSTCSASGTKGYKPCTLCQKKFDAEGNVLTSLYISINSSAHLFGAWVEEVPSTCTTRGTKGYKPCTLCQKKFDAEGVRISDINLAIDSNAHDLGQWIEEVPATCMQSGSKGHKSCSRCRFNFDAEGNRLSSLTISASTAPHTDDPGYTYTSNSNGTHKKIHTCCQRAVDSQEACTGGTATCLAAKTCALCGTAYGELDAANHEKGATVYAPNGDHGHKISYACCYALHTENEAHTLQNGTCSACAYAVITRVNASGEADEQGEYILFGQYPTSRADYPIEDALTARVTLPTVDEANGWTGYGYFGGVQENGEAFTEEYMWYIDMVYNGIKYRGVYYTSYRPYYEGEDPNDGDNFDYTWQDRTYTKGHIFWFVYEPIKWRILSQTGGQALLLCESILDAQAYNDSDTNGDTIYANNYKESTIRAWLNQQFYATAFEDYQKTLIAVTAVDNSASSTAYPENTCTCADTEDKVFLLSYQDVLNEDYGFTADPDATDEAREKAPTAYARIQGFYGNPPYSNSWALRSPSTYKTGSAYVNYDGVAGTGGTDGVAFLKGIAPAITVTLP